VPQTNAFSFTAGLLRHPARSFSNDIAGAHTRMLGKAISRSRQSAVFPIKCRCRLPKTSPTAAMNSLDFARTLCQHWVMLGNIRSQLPCPRRTQFMRLRQTRSLPVPALISAALGFIS